ncbi:MAG: transporter substrate-binding domain-containing protein [Candidimonas sp.]|nr:MAG: transporter substrate-binding domain-containing protein [Candidimonas sp.]TAM25389.1 MAG: transporter substrate-binding domain-containing protein [Candidimonas sp.]
MSYAKRILISSLTSSLLTFSCAAVHAQTIAIPTRGESPTIDRIVSSGVLNAGAAILSPWLLQDPKTSKYIGPVALISQEVAKALNVKLEYVPATWDTLIAGLLAKKYEIAAAAILATPQREKAIGFVNFGYSGTCYVVRPNSPIKSLSDLNNPKLLYLGYVGLANGTLYHEKYPKTRMQLISPPPGYGPRVDEVLSGRGDIAAIDSPLAFWVNHKWPKAKVIPKPEDCLKHPDLNRTVGIGYPKGDKVFEKFLMEVVAANKTKIDASTEQFSQPEWLNKR